MRKLEEYFISQVTKATSWEMKAPESYTTRLM